MVLGHYLRYEHVGMTEVAMSANRVIMRDGKIATEQECCCCPCYVEGLPVSIAACVPLEFIDTCDQIEADFLNLKAQFEAAGYTVDLQQLPPEEMPDCGEYEPCGWRMSFSCDSCSEQWFQPFFPEPYNDPDLNDFYLIDFVPQNDGLQVSLFNIAMPCPLDGQVYPVPGYPGNLIAFYTSIPDENGINQPAYVIPYCGNPLP